MTSTKAIEQAIKEVKLDIDALLIFNDKDALIYVEAQKKLEEALALLREHALV